jgi:hypothetical protein
LAEYHRRHISQRRLSLALLAAARSPAISHTDSSPPTRLPESDDEGAMPLAGATGTVAPPTLSDSVLRLRDPEAWGGAALSSA